MLPPAMTPRDIRMELFAVDGTSPVIRELRILR